MNLPDRDPALQRLYGGLFADDLATLTAAPAASPPWARLLTDPAADAEALRSLASAADTESRVAALAWRRLQALGRPVPRRVLLGVVVEVPLPTGQDTLAAYRDGSVRFLHGSGRATVVEGPHPALDARVRSLLQAAQAVVDRIGPSDQPRGGPPMRDVRLSFIVSDGLYLGEGPLDALMADPLAGPVMRGGVALLDAITALG